MTNLADISKLVLGGSGPGGRYTAEERQAIQDFRDAVQEHKDRLLATALANLPPYTLARDDNYCGAETEYKPATAYRVIINARTWGLHWAVEDGWAATPWASEGTPQRCQRRGTEREAVADVVAAHLATVD